MAKPQHVISARKLHVTYPCCGKQALLLAFVSFPKQGYTRRCKPCTTTWYIERTVLSSNSSAIIDKLEWLDTNTRLYTNKYGSSK